MFASASGRSSDVRELRVRGRHPSPPPPAGEARAALPDRAAVPRPGRAPGCARRAPALVGAQTGTRPLPPRRLPRRPAAPARRRGARARPVAYRDGVRRAGPPADARAHVRPLLQSRELLLLLRRRGGTRRDRRRRGHEHALGRAARLRAPMRRRLLWRYPAATLVAGARIYTHALRLKLKGAPYFRHPERAR